MNGQPVGAGLCARLPVTHPTTDKQAGTEAGPYAHADKFGFVEMIETW